MAEGSHLNAHRRENLKSHKNRPSLPKPETIVRVFQPFVISVRLSVRGFFFIFHDYI
jgi:hypothetical protein